jgi:K+-transporting ATPase KdpF subunit
MDGLLSNWDYGLWGLLALGLLIYLAYALVRAERF